MKPAEFLGSIGAVLLIVFFLRKAFKGLHTPSKQRKDDVVQLEDTIKQMREDLEALKKPKD